MILFIKRKKNMIVFDTINRIYFHFLIVYLAQQKIESNSFLKSSKKIKIRKQDLKNVTLNKLVGRGFLQFT